MIMKEMLLTSVMVYILSVPMCIELQSDYGIMNRNMIEYQGVVGNLTHQSNNNLKNYEREPNTFSRESNSQLYIDFELALPINKTILRSYLHLVYPATSWLDDKSLHILEIL